MAGRNTVMETEEEEVVSRNFIEQGIGKGLAEGVYNHVQIRFPPESDGYLHVGHAKSILLSYGLTQKYGGKFSLRFDDTNPTKEETEFVEFIMDDVKWLDADFEDRLFFASNYLDQMYRCAMFLVKKGRAFVCDLIADQIRGYRGDFTTPSKESPYRNRSVKESLALFEGMKKGKYRGGEKVLGTKIDMASPNIGMRDPVIYRVARMSYHSTGDKWCIYPVYGFAHLIEDVTKHITHSICILESEDHRPLHDWVVKECELESPPRQIGFAKLYLTSVIAGKHYIKKLVEGKVVDGRDDPRLVSIAALRRRGYTPGVIKMFVEMVGVSKASNSVDYIMLEYCIREDLKPKESRVVVILNPVKLVIDNYPEGRVGMLEVPSNLENPELGDRKVPFGRELYIEWEDFVKEPPKEYFRMFPGNGVRLIGTYFVRCTGCEKDADGDIIVVHGTYSPETKGGSSFEGRKVKGIIHWVAVPTARQTECRLYKDTMDEEGDKLNEDGSLNLNPHSLVVLKECYVRPALAEGKAYDSYQFVCNGFFCMDCKDSMSENPVFNRIISLKSSFELPK